MKWNQNVWGGGHLAAGLLKVLIFCFFLKKMHLKCSQAEGVDQPSC